uniref:Uncharacterized protein n=1 Tax=Seriola dumerili TaxID=41447 RepID=A0A3B4UKK7_SERDU
MCAVVKCQPEEASHQWSDKYLCEYYGNTGYSYDRWCGKWDYVITNTGGADWGYRPQKASSGADPLRVRMSLIKGSQQPNCQKGGCNPLYLTLKRPQLSDTGIYVLGSLQTGSDPLGNLIITVSKKPMPNPTNVSITANLLEPVVKYLTNFTYESKLALETGYNDKNEWLEWVQYTALTTGKSNCLACAKARPVLGTVPFRLSDSSDPAGLQCAVKLFKAGVHPTNDKCKTLELLFPAVKSPDTPPSVVVYAGNYTCFERSGNDGLNVRDFPSGYCETKIDITAGSGNYTALAFVEQNTWKGTCTIAQLLMPFHMVPIESSQLGGTLPHRHRRSIPGGSFDSQVYIDAIGVPRGVPDEFKARNQISAGFESLLWWVTVNKNVDWINYIYYNQQRFVNYTRDAVKGIAEQLGPTSLMSWQNRMALDMLLAEKGGVCKMFGEYCCTYIPNNTALDGSITKALAGLTSLSLELAENSGVDDPFGGWFDSYFGKYKALIMSLVVSIGCFLAILVCCGCCCIPCLRTLINQLITTALSKEKDPPPYQMPLLSKEMESDDEDEGDEETRLGTVACDCCLLLMEVYTLKGVKGGICEKY